MTSERYRRTHLAPDGQRYVKYDGAGAYSWCETSVTTRAGWRYDIAQGTCEIDDLPPEVAMAAIARRNGGVWPFYVEWPL